jgi:hypothetical protein
MRDAMDALRREASDDARTAKSCGSGTPWLVPSLLMKSAGDGD